jgi:hypothetical protein
LENSFYRFIITWNIQRIQIDSTEINSEIIRADPAYQKLQRSRLVLDTIEQIKKYGEKGIAIQNIHECENVTGPLRQAGILKIT